jgi:hypothetical protein
MSAEAAEPGDLPVAEPEDPIELEAADGDEEEANTAAATAAAAAAEAAALEMEEEGGDNSDEQQPPDAASASSPEEALLFERSSFHASGSGGVPVQQRVGGGGIEAAMGSPLGAGETPGSSLFDRYASEGTLARRYMGGGANGATLTSRLRSMSTKLACYLNTEWYAGPQRPPLRARGPYSTAWAHRRPPSLRR